MESMVERFVRYTSINTRSNEESTTIPSTQTQVDFATNVLVPDLKAIGLDEVIYNRENGFVIGTLNANTDEKAPAIGFIAHMDTADYNAENIKPRIVENYDGDDICLNEEHQIFTRRADFPNLKNYIGRNRDEYRRRGLCGCVPGAERAAVHQHAEYRDRLFWPEAVRPA